MPKDPMAEEIAAKQYKAHRAMYSPQANEEFDRMIRERSRKEEFLNLLRSDPKFRKEVRKILNSQE